MYNLILYPLLKRVGVATSLMNFMPITIQGRLMLEELTSLNVFITKFYEFDLFKYIH